MQKQIESMNEIKDTIDDYYDKDLPLIEELSEIKNNNNKMGLGFQNDFNSFIRKKTYTRTCKKTINYYFYRSTCSCYVIC